MNIKKFRLRCVNIALGCIDQEGKGDINEVLRIAATIERWVLEAKLPERSEIVNLKCEAKS